MLQHDLNKICNPKIEYLYAILTLWYYHKIQTL